jgi:hypothetical protein
MEPMFKSRLLTPIRVGKALLVLILVSILAVMARIDRIRPRITKVTPERYESDKREQDQTPAEVDLPLIVEFSEPIKRELFVKLTDADDKEIKVDFRVTEFKSEKDQAENNEWKGKLIITPRARLKHGEKYYVKLSGVRDLAGNELRDEVSEPAAWTIMTRQKAEISVEELAKSITSSKSDYKNKKIDRTKYHQILINSNVSYRMKRLYLDAFVIGSGELGSGEKYLRLSPFPTPLEDIEIIAYYKESELKETVRKGHKEFFSGTITDINGAEIRLKDTRIFR